MNTKCKYILLSPQLWNKRLWCRVHRPQSQDSMNLQETPIPDECIHGCTGHQGKRKMNLQSELNQVNSYTESILK